MYRKLTIVLLILLIPTLVFASLMRRRAIVAVAESTTTTTAASACWSGTYMFAYNGDYTADTDKACFTNGDVNKDGTVVDATVTSDYVEYSAVNDYVEWVVSAEDGFSDEQGTVYLSLFIVDDGAVGENQLMEFFGDANDYMKIQTFSSAVFGAYHFSETEGSDYTVGSEVLADTWYRLGIAWKTGTGDPDFSASMNGGSSWADDTDGLEAWTDAVTAIRIGEKDSGENVSDTVRIKDVVILSTYKAADIL